MTSVGAFHPLHKRSELGHPCGFDRNEASCRVSHEPLGDPMYVERYDNILRAFLDGPGTIAANKNRLLVAWEVLGEEYREDSEEDAVLSPEDRGRAMLDVLARLPASCPICAWPGNEEEY
jgi:hypothetical protein